MEAKTSPAKHEDHVIGIGLKYEFNKDELKPENFEITKMNVLSRVHLALDEMHDHYMQFHQ